MYTAEMRLSALAADLRGGKKDLMQFVHELCDRIEEVDPQLHALVPERDRRARLVKEAEDLLQRYPDPGNRPALFGIPVGVKDIFRTEGLPTQAGSLLPSSLFDGHEAHAVSVLREAGALLLGKTVTTEFAYFEPGPTVNPHHTDHTPGGSSSGSAAAVAAGFCPLALGTQTVGSVIRPAAFCGIVGFKPSYNRIAKDGVIACSPSLDHVGLFAQDVASIPLPASLLCTDWQDPAQKEQMSFETLVLGVPDGPYLSQMPAEGLQRFEAHLRQLEKAGWRVERVSAFEHLNEIVEQHEHLMAREMADVHADWFARYAPLYRPRTKENILRGQKISDQELAETRHARLAHRQALEKRMDDAGIDLWVCPSTLGPAPQGIDSTGDPAMNLPWTNAGLPAITIPVDQSENGLPIGLQFVGRFGQDEQLVYWAEKISHSIGM